MKELNRTITDSYLTVYTRLRHMVFSGEIKSMKAIKETVHEEYVKSDLDDFSFHSVYGERNMVGDLLSVYIIHCEVAKIIPVSGY